MRSILIPTDFSENARNAAQYAFSCFDREKDRFILLHAYSIPHDGSSAIFKSFTDALKDDALRELKKEKEQLVKLLGDKAEKIELVAELGVLSTVVDYVKNIYQTDYIVMGTKGASGLEEIFIGSNAYDVVKDVNCPTIIVPENAIFKKPSKLVFAVDFNGIDDRVALAPLLDRVKANNAELHILNVQSAMDGLRSEEAIERLRVRNYFDAVENHSYHTVVDESIIEGIEKYVRSVEADMVVMLAREKSFFEEVFQKSVTRKAVLHLLVPVLALHDK